MPKTAGRELTDDLFRRLCGKFINEHANKVVLINTVDENGWPHPAILSYFEVAAKDPRHIRIAAYKTSRTTQNIRRTGRVTLSIFDERVVYYIKGVGTVEADMRTAPHNARVELAVKEVLIDQADPVLEPGAYISRGITYVNPNGPAVSVLTELMEGNN